MTDFPGAAGQLDDAVTRNKSFDTLALAIADTGLEDGDLVAIDDRDGFNFNVVLTSTLTPNDYNQPQSTGNPLLTLKLKHDGTITPEAWGIRDSTTVEFDDSVGIQLIFDDNSVHRVNGDPTKTYFFKLIDTNKQKFTWDGGIFKFNRTAGEEINTFNWNDWLPPNDAHSTGEEWLIRFTKPALGDSGVMFKNITIEGNGEPFATSANYPNQFVKMIDIVSCRHIIFDNVHIKRNNGNGFFVYNSEYVSFTNGSVLETVGLTGAITPFEQISLIASRYCTVAHNDLGRMTPNSCINTAGGFVDVIDGTEVGGFVPFNSPDGVDNSYIYFGLATGGSDSFHRIHDNTCRSDLLDGAEAGGGGVLGRMITINSGRCFIKDNIVYDTTGLSQAGIGLGHDDTTITVQPAYGRMASRSEVSGNVCFGFQKAGQGYGILNNGSEDCNVHDNEVYNCLRGIAHTRLATTSRYEKNWIFFNDIALEMSDFSGAASSHGIVDLVKIHGNTCWNNLQDIITTDNTTYGDFSIKDNDFTQVRSNSLVQFDIFHGLLSWEDNRIVNNSSVLVGDFFTRAVGRHIDFNSTTIECLQDSSADLFAFDGSSGDVVGRGSLSINDLKVDCPVGSLNRRFNIRRTNTKGLTINNPQMFNCRLVVQSKSGDVNIDGGYIQTQGSDECLSILLNDVADPKIVQISNILFPATGAATPIITNITAAAGHIIVNSCTTKENKEVTDRANGNEMRNNNCWKITAGVLTTSRP